MAALNADRSRFRPGVPGSRAQHRTELILGLVAAVTALGALPLRVAADATRSVPITEWTVPWKQSRPQDPFVDAAYRVWFVSGPRDYVALLDPFSGKFSRFPVQPGSAPHSVLVTDDRVWYAASGAGHIGQLDLAQGVVLQYPMPEPSARDPHSLAFGTGGNLWFTVQHGNFAGRLLAGVERIRLARLPTPGARPYDIVVDARGRAWVSEFGTNRIAVVDPATMQVVERELPRTGARPRRLAIDSQGAVWYTDYAQGYLGRLEPEGGEVTEWRAPGGAGARPFAIAVDHRDRVWFVETGTRPNRFVGFDPARGRFFARTGIGSGGGSVRRMRFHAPGREIWFGTDAGTIGRAEVDADAGTRD